MELGRELEKERAWTGSREMRGATRSLEPG